MSLVGWSLTFSSHPNTAAVNSTTQASRPTSPFLHQEAVLYVTICAFQLRWIYSLTPPISTRAHISLYTHTHTHTYTHTYTHTHVHTRTHIHTCIHTYTHTYTHTHTHTHTVSQHQVPQHQLEGPDGHHKAVGDKWNKCLKG